MEPTTFVGLDVHKRTTSVAIADPGRGGEVRFLGEIPSSPEALHRLVERLKAWHRRLSRPVRLRRASAAQRLRPGAAPAAYSWVRVRRETGRE
jgi:hypothetical protein